MSTKRSHALCLGLATFALTVSSGLGVALADPAGSKAQSKSASALAAEASQLMKAKETKAACTKLEESHALDPDDRVLVRLGDCYRELGRAASAWSAFREAASSARASGDAVLEHEAKQRAESVKAKLSYLTIEVDAPVDGLEVRHDGALVHEGFWGGALPVDPGEHMIEVRAPGKKAWVKRVSVAASSNTVQVVVPALEDGDGQGSESGNVSPLTQVSTTFPKVQDTQVDGSSQRTWGWVLIGAGGAALATGGVFAFMAMDSDSAADGACSRRDPTLCTQEGVAYAAEAGDRANIATAAMGIGAALSVTGVVLMLTAPNDKKPVALSTGFSPSSTQVQLTGSF